MNNQLKVFVDSILHTLLTLRLEGVERYNWAIDALAQVFLACDLGVIDSAARGRLFSLMDSARLYSQKPFPSEKNAGPCISWFELHKRDQAAVAAATVEAKPVVQAAEPVAVQAESKPKEGWGQPLLARKVHYFVGGMSLCSRWLYAGRTFNGLDYHENDCATCKRKLSVKLQAQDSANEKPEPVPAPAPRRELRLLCLLGKPHLGASQARYLPIHTLHRLPPRTMVSGKWSEPRYAGLYLRETQAVAPTAEVLARCVRQRQAHALRAYSRAFRVEGVKA